MRASDFDFSLPSELVAQSPTEQRDQSRLLVLERAAGKVSHRNFPDILDFLCPGDVLVLNESKVIPARLRGVNRATGGEFEILLLEENAVNDWWAMLRPGKRARRGTRIVLRKTKADDSEPIEAEVIDHNTEGHRRLRFTSVPNILDALDNVGEVPLPPYIQRASGADLAEDLARYQTVYARERGSVAAPTAGLHFTNDLLGAVCERGVRIACLTLHVGAGTFARVKVEELTRHAMHEERFLLGEEAARTIRSARAEGGRIIAVGTTSARVLETVAAAHQGEVMASAGRTRLFIYPPYRFQAVDALLTNFHLPRSTLLMLVSAFAAPGDTLGRDIVASAYAEAIALRYRFFSYGDAMLLL